MAEREIKRESEREREKVEHSDTRDDVTLGLYLWFVTVSSAEGQYVHSILTKTLKLYTNQPVEGSYHYRVSLA